MPRFKITASAKVEIHYFIDAETEEQALKLYEDIDASMGELDEDSIDSEEFESIEELPGKKS